MLVFWHKRDSAMNHEKNYVIQTDIKFGALEKIDIEALQKACTHEF